MLRWHATFQKPVTLTTKTSTLTLLQMFVDINIKIIYHNMTLSSDN